MTEITRRRAVQAALSAVAAGALSRTNAAVAAPGKNDQLTLWYAQPARQWVEALPIGNGRIGAMVFGGTSEERLQLNEDTLWGGGPYDPANAEALPALPEVRKLILEGRYAEAQT